MRDAVRIFAAMREHALKIAADNPLLRAQVEGTVAWHDKYGWPRTTELTQELAAKLRSRSYRSMNVHCHNMPDETHMSVAPAAISRGLRFVFDFEVLRNDPRSFTHL